MKVLHFAGFSGSGKTRLLERLVPLLPIAAYLKWTHHPLPDEIPGSDTARLASWGIPQVLASPDGLIIRPLPSHRATVLQWLANNLEDDQLLLVEGFKGHPAPKIWVGRGAPQDLKATLVIGPEAPPQGEWYKSGTPLTDDELTRTAHFLQENWVRFTYTIMRTSHE